eukprot:3672310-Prymnesium_polylepis.1
MAFAAAEFSDENLLFWVEVRDAFLTLGGPSRRATPRETEEPYPVVREFITPFRSTRAACALTCTAFEASYGELSHSKPASPRAAPCPGAGRRRGGCGQAAAGCGRHHQEISARGLGGAAGHDVVGAPEAL